MFAVQYPMVNVPSRNKAPNHKVENIFSHLIQVSTETFESGRNISSKNKDTSFQGQHEDKKQVTLKCEIDGVFIDVFCEDGYTIGTL